MTAILRAPAIQVRGFLGLGHVCAVVGPQWRYQPIAEQLRVPIVVAGFEPLDLLEGVLPCGPPARSGAGGGGEPIRPCGSSGWGTWPRSP